MRYRKSTENLYSKIFKTKNGRLILQSRYTECGFKKPRAMKKLEAKGLLSSLGLTTH